MTNFPWDIVLLAILALLMAGTLFCVLGRRIGAQGLKQEASPAVRAHEARQADEKTSPVQPPPLPNQLAPEENRTEYVIPESHTALSDELTSLQQKLPGFTAEGFLHRVEAFFRDVVSASTRADMTFLQTHLTSDAFEAFKTVIEARKKEGHQAFCEIRRIERLEYKDITLVSPNAETNEAGHVLFRIAVISWQISNIKDAEKNIVDGTEALTEFHDLWGISCPLNGGELLLDSAAVF